MLLAQDLSSCLCPRCSLPQLSVLPDTHISHSEIPTPASPPSRPTIPSSAPHNVSITTPDNILELVLELQQDLEQTHRSLRRATQAFEATFRRLTNSRNTIRGTLDTMPQDISSSSNDMSNGSSTSAMGPGHSALVLSPPQSPTSTTADSLRILLDTVERQTFWMDDPAAPDPPRSIPNSSSAPRPRTSRPGYTSFFGPRHEIVRSRIGINEEQHRASSQNTVNTASTSLGRRVAARAAATSSSGQIPSSEDLIGTRVAELALNVDDAISRLNYHSEELLAASDNLRRGPSRLLGSTSDILPSAAPRVATVRPLGMQARRENLLQRSSRAITSSDPTPTSSRTRPTGPALTPRVRQTDNAASRPGRLSPVSPTASNASPNHRSIHDSFTRFMANRSPEAQQRLEDFIQRSPPTPVSRPTTYDIAQRPSFMRSVSAAIDTSSTVEGATESTRQLPTASPLSTTTVSDRSRAPTIRRSMNLGSLPVPDGGSDPGQNPFSRARGWGACLSLQESFAIFDNITSSSSLGSEWKRDTHG